MDREKTEISMKRGLGTERGREWKRASFSKRESETEGKIRRVIKREKGK